MTATTVQPLQASAEPRRWSGERVFYSSMAGLFLLPVFLGYAPSYYLRGLVDPGRPLHPMSPLVHLHGLLSSLWIVLFLVQTSLVAGRRSDLHRKLGIGGVALAIAMLVVGTLTAVNGVGRASGPPGIPPLQWLAIPLFDLPCFGILVGAALILRRKSQAHKRLMLITMIGLMAPAVARLPLEVVRVWAFMLSNFLLLALVAWDLMTRKRIHPATVAGGVLLVALRLLPPLVWETEGWRRFAGWMVRLLG